MEEETYSKQNSDWSSKKCPANQKGKSYSRLQNKRPSNDPDEATHWWDIYLAHHENNGNRK